MPVCNYPNGKTSRQSQKYRSARKRKNPRDHPTSLKGPVNKTKSLGTHGQSRRGAPAAKEKCGKCPKYSNNQNLQQLGRPIASVVTEASSSRGAARLHTAALSLSFHNEYETAHNADGRYPYRRGQLKAAERNCRIKFLASQARKTVSFGEKLQCSLASAARSERTLSEPGRPRPLRAEVPLRLTLSIVLDPRSETLSRIVGGISTSIRGGLNEKEMEVH